MPMQGCDLALKRLLASLSKGVEIIRALVFQCHGGSYYALTSSHTAFGSRLHSNSSFSVSRTCQLTALRARQTVA